VEAGGCGGCGWRLRLKAEAVEAVAGGWRLEAMEVDSGSIRSCNALVQSTHPGPQPSSAGN